MQRLQRILWTATGALALAIAAAAIVLVVFQRDQALYEGELRALHFVAGAEAAVNRSFVGIDVLLAGFNATLKRCIAFVISTGFWFSSL